MGIWSATTERESLNGGRRACPTLLFLFVSNPGFEECGMRDLMEKEPYPGGKLTPQSTWPDAAQQLGTGTIGEKWET